MKDAFRQPEALHEQRDCLQVTLSWDAPGVRDVLSDVLSGQRPVLEYPVELDSPSVGRKY